MQTMHKIGNYISEDNKEAVRDLLTKLFKLND
jgi:hypothetical protein